MSSGDEMDPNTQVPAVRCASVHVTMSYHARQSMSLFLEDPAPTAFIGTERLPGAIVRDRGRY
jgi:hypothetical protein